MHDDKNENIQFLCFVISDELNSSLLIKTFQRVISKIKVKTSFSVGFLLTSKVLKQGITLSLGKMLFLSFFSSLF